MKRTKTDDRTFRILAAVVIVLGLSILVAVRLSPRRPDRCPIDGHVAQWTKRSGGNTCDYGHFSGAERTHHTWSAAWLEAWT
jgi:hypothetical protein